MLISQSKGQIYHEFYLGFQSREVDSILFLLGDLKEEALADAFNRLSRLHLQYDPAKAMGFARQAYEISGEIGYIYGTGMAYMNMGNVRYYEGNYTEAAGDFFDAKQQLEKTGCKIELADCYTRLAVSFFYSRAKIQTAIDLGKKALNIYHEVGDKKTEAYVYIYFSRYHIDIQQYDEALGELEISENIFVNQDIGTRFDKALVFIMSGEATWKKGKHREALNIYRKGLTYLDTNEMEDCSILSLNYETLGSYFTALDDSDSAYFYHSRGLELAQRATSLIGIAWNSWKLSRFFAMQKKYQEAIHLLSSAIQSAHFIDSTGYYYLDEECRFLRGASLEIGEPSAVSYRKDLARHLMKGIRYDLYKIYIALDDYPMALKHYQEFKAMDDSNQAYLRNKELKELGFKYDTEQKNQRIHDLEQENKLKEMMARQSRVIFSGAGILMLLVILVLILFIRQWRLKSRQETILLEQKLLRSRMNPHFIFNSLASIQHKIISEEPGIAFDYLARFSLLFRMILENSTEEYNSLDKEIVAIENYLELQQLRFPGRFDYTININENIEPESALVPTMLAQPFIENAIEHGIKHKEGKGRIQIRIMRSHNRTIEQSNNRTIEQTIFEVEDDGIGREKAQEILMKQDAKHKSLATVITRERIAALNRKSKKKITLEIIDLKDCEGQARGTLVRFGLPLH